jgi:hypothetical protein
LTATNELVRAMSYRVFFASIASLSAVALMLAANQAMARSGAVARGGIARPIVSHAFRHHHARGFGAFWPGYDDFAYGPSSYGEPVQAVPQPTSSDLHYTQTYDVPWDWAHRFPPNVTPSDHPYVSSCPVETLTFHERDGSDKTVNVMRCY